MKLNDSGRTMTEATNRVNVFARLRPFSERENEVFHAVRADESSGKIIVDDVDGAMEHALRASFNSSASASFDGGGRPGGAKTYEFDGVFDTQSTQAEVFDDVALPVLNSVLQGYHGCIFAYGQTGSGKTFTLLNSGSTVDGFKEAGLLPRLVATLFVRARMDATHVYVVEAGSFQVYNEQVDDLLHPQHREGGGHNLAVSRTAAGQGVVDGLTWIACSSANSLLEHFAKARKNVVYAETKMNKASSRSHACFQLRVSRRPRDLSTHRGTVATLSVIDLAGSERVKRSGVQGKELKEAVNINGSLLALGNVVSALATGGKKHVPYRDSKLTRLLEGRVGGNCRTNLIVCCSPSADSASETVSTLAFAARAMRVKVAATINEVDDVIPDAAGLAVVPSSDDAARSEARQRQSEAEAKAALESRRQAEEALRRERQAKEVAVAREREAARMVAEKLRRESEVRLDNEKKAAEAMLNHERKTAEAKLRESSAAVEKSTADAKEHREEALKLKVTNAELDAENKSIKARLASTTHELEVAEQTVAQQKKLRVDAEKREAGLRGRLDTSGVEKSKLEHRCRALESELRDVESKRQEENQLAQSEKKKLQDELKRMEEGTLATKHELEQAREALSELQGHFDATAKLSAIALEEERQAAATERARLVDQLQLAVKDGAALRATVTSVTLERDSFSKAWERSQCESVVNAVATAAAASAELEDLESRHRARLTDVERHAAGERATFDSCRADYEVTVAAQGAKLELVSKQLSDTLTELDTARAQSVEHAARDARDREKQVEKHAQLEQQLQALEERAQSELRKAVTARDAAIADRAALVASAAVLERRLAHEARNSEALAEEISQLRTENVAAATRFEENIQTERERGNQATTDLEHLARRFENREARAQDLEAIDRLRDTVQAERQKAKELMHAALLTQRELEHVKHIDRIFGPESARYRKERDQVRRLDAERATSRPASARRRPTNHKLHIKSTNQSSMRGAAVKLSSEV